MPSASRHAKTAMLEDMRALILTQVFAPGADLDEATLCERWQLSRTPLREGLRQLAGEGYVDIRENRGARVAEMSHTTLRSFFQAAPMIYGAILRLAAENATAVQLEELRAAQTHFKATLAAADTGARALANNRFHEITGQMAANPYLLPSFQRLLIDHARISMTFYRPGAKGPADSTAQASAQHDQIIEAIAARDGTEAARLAEAHWNLSRDRIEHFVMPAGLDMTLGGSP